MTESREEEKEGCSAYDWFVGTDAVFMDVYPSASPEGSSHFPLAKSWSGGRTFLILVMETHTDMEHRHDILRFHQRLFTCRVL